MQDQQQTLQKFFSAESRRGLNTRRVTRSLSTLKPPRSFNSHSAPWPPPPFELKLPCPGQPGSGGCGRHGSRPRGQAARAAPPERREAFGALRRGRPRCLPPRGGGGRRRGRKEDGTNLPTESISRRRCKSRMLWISLCASRSMSSCGISASFKDTHTAGHRAAPGI